MASASEAEWQIGSRDTLLERNKYMFNKSLMSDIKFAFPNEQIIPAHKYVLAISSPVFFAMFYGGLAEQGETVDITDCDPETFLQFLRYLYCDDTNFRDVNNAIEVWHLADKYDLPSLANECVNFVEAAMEPLNAFRVIPCARRFNHKGLENVCWEIIDYNAQEIIANESFLDLKPEHLHSFLERSSLCVKETSLFKAVDRWAAKRCEESNMTVDGTNKRSVLGEDLLKLIRFSLMSPEEFSEIVLPTDILLTTEVIDVFKQFTSATIPGGLKFSILPRESNCKDLSTLLTCPLGQIFNPHPHRRAYGKIPYEIRAMEKSAVLTFMLREAFELFGVKILTTRPELCFVGLCLSVFQGDKMISQMKTKCTANRETKEGIPSSSTSDAPSFGEIDVFLNRPIFLYEYTCYTIKTHTDTSQITGVFVWSESLENSIEKPCKHDPKLFICSGHYTECIPTFAHYKGEVVALLGKLGSQLAVSDKINS